MRLPFSTLPRTVRIIRWTAVATVAVIAGIVLASRLYKAKPQLMFPLAIGPMLVVILVNVVEKHLHAGAKRAGFRVCPRCGYSLMEIETGRCPECGSPFTSETLRQAWSFRK